MALDYIVDLRADPEPPTSITSAFGDIVLVAHTKGSTGEAVVVTADGWTQGTPVLGGNLLWRQDTGEGMGFTPVITNPDEAAVSWSVVRITGVTRSLDNVRYANARRFGTFDSVFASVEDDDTLLAWFSLLQPGADATGVNVGVTFNLLTEPTVDSGFPVAAILRTLTPEVDFHSTQSLGGFTHGITGGGGATHRVLFVATWGELLREGLAAEPQDRLRSAVNESVTSLLESVDARPADARASEHFTYAQDLDPLVLTEFREVTQAANGVDFAYYPRPIQNTVSENQYDGVTILSRLASYFPAGIFDSVFNLSDEAATRWTAQEVITHVLEAWAADQSWFTFNAVPDLRLRLSGFTPATYGSTDGLVTTETITIDQSGESRRDALAILQDLLSPFPGTVLRQDSTGALSIVPTYGPDADSDPAVTLEEWDCYTISSGKPDPFTVYNRATVRNQGYGRSENVALMQPAWFQIGSNFQLGNSSTWYEPPGDRLNLQTPAEGDTVLQESLSSGQFGAQRPGLWPLASQSIPAGEGIGLKDSEGDPLVTAAFTEYHENGTSSTNTGTGTVTILSDEIPLTGEWVDAFKWDEGLYSITMRARWDAAQEGVAWSIGPANTEANCWNGCEAVIVEFTLNDSSVGYAFGAQKNVTFGILDNGDALPAVDGGNALADSQTAYGVREATLNINGYDLGLSTLAEIAEAYVLANITPRITRDIELTTVGTRLTFDHIGRLIELPNGEEGFLVSLDYSDDFTAGVWRKVAQVQISNTDGEGAVSEDNSRFYVTSLGERYQVEYPTLFDLSGLLKGHYYEIEEHVADPVLPPAGDPGEAPSLLGNESFNTGSPTWYDGTAITGDALDLYNGLLWWADSDNWSSHQGFNSSSDGGLDDLGGGDDLYTFARFLRERLQAVAVLLAYTGDLRWLDTLVEAMAAPKADLAVGYRGHDSGTVTWDASPYRCWVTRGGGQPATLKGTDLSTMNEVKWHAAVAMYTYALFLNKDATSPGGNDYETEYDFWIDYLTNDFTPKWSGGGTSDWRNKYRGVRRDPTYSNPHARADTGEWPIVVNGGEGHSSVSSTHLAYFMHLLTDNDAALEEFQWLTNAWLTTDSYEVSGHRLWAHTCKSQGSGSHYAQRSAYVSYEQMDMLVGTVLGMWPDNINDDLLTAMAASVNDYLLNDASDSATSISAKGTRGDIAGGDTLGGFTGSAPDSGRSMGQLTFSPNHILAAWGGSTLNNALTHAQTLSWVGTTANPKTPFLNLAEFLKLIP